MNNLRQTALAMRLYADDHSETIPNYGPGPVPLRKGIEPYLAKSSLAVESILACPSDSFYVEMGARQSVIVRKRLHRQARFDFASYSANGWNTEINQRTGEQLPGIRGIKLSTITEPAKTILAAEFGAFIGFSWHAPQKVPQFNNALNIMAFVDGHVDYRKVYWNGIAGDDSLPCLADPPGSYGYRWSAF